MNNHLTDEQIVDWIEGNLVDEEVREHLEQCEQCHASYQSWKELLDTDKSMSEFDRRRVWNGIQNKQQEKEYNHVKRRRKVVNMGWIASCFAFLIIGYLLGQSGGEQNYANQTPNQDRLDQFMNQPVEHYDMVSSEDGERQGIAWYNPANRQMILYLDDPRYLKEQAQEFQIETMNQIIPVQPNHLNNGKMQIYLKDRELHDLMQLIVKDREEEEQQRYFFQVISK